MRNKIIICTSIVLMAIVIVVCLYKVDRSPVYLFVGDSITLGCDEDSKGFPDYCDESIHIEKIAWMGVTSKELYKILTSDRKEIKDPEKIVVLVGTNDFGYDVELEESYENIKKIVSYLKKEYPDASVYLCTLLYRDYYGKNVDAISGQVNNSNISLDQYSEVVLRVAKEDKCAVIDLAKSDIINQDNLKEYTIDGLHPNKKANKLLMEYIWKEIQ